MAAPSAAAAATGSERARPGGRLWLAIVIVGLTGQVAWTVENMYLNVFVYEVITPEPSVIAGMVAASAIAATVTTLIVGPWTDRLGRRRAVIAVGYLGWGACTAAFGLLAPESGSVAAPFVATAIAIVIALDCVLSIFGSAANDAAFGAWVTDSTTPAMRGRVDGVLAVLPLIATLLVFGVLDGFTRAGQWRLFFAIVGGATAVAGVCSWLLIRDRPVVTAGGDRLFDRLREGLRPSTIRRHPALYLTLVCLMIIGISAQVFLPYVIIYLQYWLRIDSYAFILGVVLISASVLSVLAGRLMDRVGKRLVLLPAAGVFVIGLLFMVLARDVPSIMAAATLAIAGMMTATASTSATARDLTPEGRAGMVQGLRMILGVLVPMLIGPFIGAAVISGAGQTYLELGVERPVPGPEMFAASAAVLVLLPIAVLVRRRVERRAK